MPDRLVQPPLNRIPRGLLSFFGIKSGDWGPRTLDFRLQPTIELLEWYTQLDSVCTLLDAANIVSADSGSGRTWTTSSNPDIPITTGLQVPQNEAWLILEYSCTWQLVTAGNVCELSPAISRIDAGGGYTPLPSVLIGPTTVAASPTPVTGTRQITTRQWARPGDTLFTHCNQAVSAGGIDIFGRLRISRFQL